MKLKTTYDEILKNPYIIKDLEEKRKKSKSKDAKNSLSSFDFTYDWGEKIQGHSFADVISGKSMMDAQERRKKSAEELTKERAKNCFVSICATNKRCQLISKTLPVTPKSVYQFIFNEVSKQKAEEKRIDKLTPEQRQNEVNEALKQLRGTPGFMEFKIVPKDLMQ